MKSYDEIKTILESELNEAVAIHERETLNREHTGAAVERANERYSRVALHGMIPEDFIED